jgi:hypothetical protein
MGLGSGPIEYMVARSMATASLDVLTAARALTIPGPVRQTSQPVPRPDRRAMLAAAVTVVLWASAFVAIRSAGRDFSPGALALGRLLPGAAVLAVISLSRRVGWPPRAAPGRGS